MSVIATGTVTINAAFLQEIKEVNEELWGLLKKLRHTATRPIGLNGSCRSFVNMLLELRDQLALHFALEEAFGYFEDPAEVAPHIAHEAAKLRDEHRRLYSQLNVVCDRAEMLLDEGQHALIGASLPKQFLDFDAALDRHEHRENELLMAALDQDIGCGD